MVNPSFELHTTELSYQEENKIGKWKFEQVNDFKNNIDGDKIRNVIDELSVYSNQENVTKYEINTVVTNITDILIDSAKATFGTHNFNGNMLNCNRKHNKQWYNFDCKKAKKELRKAQRMYKHYGSNLFKERLRHCEYYYKSVMDENIKKYNREITARELRDTGFGISEQFPKEINDRRKTLWPFFQEARRQSKKAFFRRDRLFIDGVEFFPPEKTDQKNSGVTRQQPRRNYDDEGARPKSTQRNNNGRQTKLDDCDLINCDEFIFSFKNRHKLSNHRSGGIALGYRKYLEKYIKPIETECKFVYWFTIDKRVLNLPENVFIGIVYIPPVNTNYTSEEAFNDIELELQRYSEKSDYIILVGDFNSHTANLSDFYDEGDIDDFVIDNLTDQSDYTDVYMLDDLNISRTRNNPDKVVNCYGRTFLEFCKNNKVFILNGRVGQDVIGRPTSRNNSVIDYIVCTPHF
ncbi:unnamed protein product [Mytilus coruscus]|uniref:Endonuclease/exonuclease/phosphatase domain-containing protein n=1 Tax=Mytilus coruscus TaxID=42192 RepID=A0A6J8AVG5_MYTCO|nr:unnamed protein product [Mytilus coruscus]